MFSKEFNQRIVRLAVDGARGEADLDSIAVATRKFRARSARLDMQVENHNDAIPGRMCQSTISTTWMRTTSTSGVRSNWPTGGM